MKKILLILTITAVVWGCDKTDLNIDPKSPVEVPGEPLFTNATRNLVDMMADINVNRNVFKLYAQYWAQTTYPDESQYNMVSRKNPDNWWRALYRDVLNDYKFSAVILGSEVTTNAEAEAILKNKLAIIDVMEVYTYSILVDLFGDVPYSEALNPDNILPKYDAASSVYDAILTDLDNALSNLNAGFSAFSANEDPIYEGDVAAWITFANSLKLRLALRIADANDAKAKSLVAAVKGKVMTSNDDNCTMTYYKDAPNTNPMWVDLVQSGRSDFVPANTIVDKMNSLDDPRRAVYFTQIDTSSTLGVEKLAFVVGIYGTANAFTSFSHIGPVFHAPDLGGTILSYAEVEFLLAEAAERGYDVSGTAADHYIAAIKASMNEWGVASADADAYVAKSEVAYATATGNWKQKIGVQKWIAFYNQGFEGWTVWRQFDIPGFNVPDVDGMTAADIPVRFIYPITEATLNPDQYDAAAARYNNDSPTAKIFWDVN